MTTQSLRILVVDDDAGVRRVLGRMLERDGHVALLAEDAAAAYRLLQHEPADLVLLDAWLPDAPGDAAYAAIVARWPALEGRVAFITGDTDATDHFEPVRAGRAFVLAKPFSVEQLRAACARLAAGEVPRRRSNGHG